MGRLPSGHAVLHRGLLIGGNVFPYALPVGHVFGLVRPLRGGCQGEPVIGFDVVLLDAHADRIEQAQGMTDRISLTLAQADPDVAAALDQETLRQHEGLEMIASENFVSEAVLEAAGSIFTNKYAEGYPGRRYYGGCEYADVVENLARDRAKQLFGGDHINVQPHSGSQANASAYAAVLQAGDTILGLDLAHGGHLTHGHRLSFSGKLYRPTFYQVRKDTELIDYDELEAIASARSPR
jgi:glycine hydroxymethyltransferase